MFLVSKYCAVHVKTESGDDHVFCLHYNEYAEITRQIEDWMFDELAYVSSVNVDSMISAEEDDFIQQFIIRQASELREEIE